MKLKHACADPGQYGVNISPDEYRDAGIRMIRTSDLSDDGLTPPELGVFLDGPIPEAQRLQANDLLLSRAGTIGRAYLVPEAAKDQTFAGFLIRFRPYGSDPRFLHYALISRPVQEQIKAEAVTSTIQNFNADRYANLEIPDMGVEEQRRIADFLDDRVTRIDQIITARQQQGHLLRERFDTFRQASVRGIDGETVAVGTWIGRVNARWEVRRMGSLVKFYAGAGFPHESQGSASGDLPFAKVSDMQSADSLRVLSSANNWISFAQARQLGAQPAPQGTIVFPKVGAALLTNSRAVLSRSMAFDNNVMGVHFPTLSSRYWFHVLSVIDMGRLSNPGPVPSVNREAVAELRVPFPQLSDQHLIGRTLDEAMLQVEEQVLALKESARLLGEFRQSLITAAVSGELDVSTAGSGIPV